MHTFDTFHRCTCVIIGFEQPLRRSFGPNLEIGQENIHQPVEQVERLERIERGCIVDDGQAQPQILRVQHGKHNLGNHMLRGDQVDIMYLAHLLQLHVPLGQLFRRGVEPIALMRDVVVLAEDAAEVASGKEDGARAVVALDAGFLAKVGGYDIDLGGLGADEADTGPFPAVDAAASGAEVAIAQVGIGLGPLLGRVDGREGIIAGDVVIEEEWWCEVEVSWREEWRCDSEQRLGC